ncbi:MAG: hypothetical protein PVI04_10480 [Anaerolineales bacterium]|jgi:hypothetical protein
MPRIRCRYIDCLYLDDGYCSAGSIELDPDEGCLTYTHVGDVPEDEDWEDDELDEFWEEDEEDLYLDEEQEEDWLDGEEY